MNLEQILAACHAPVPSYVIEEEKLRHNLSLIRRVAEETGVEIILALKAFANWRTFPIFREYVSGTTASSPYEARLAYEEFGARTSTYSPAYEDDTFDEILKYSRHIIFNSLSQFDRFRSRLVAGTHSAGLRINPEYSEIQTELYNPCAPGSRFGILAGQLPDKLPEGIEGFHSHTHCESSSYALARTLEHIETKFGRWLPQLKWLNLGGGHLMTRKDYDVSHLIQTLRDFKSRHPNLHLIMEPGSAFAWQTGPLVSRVVDIVENHGIQTAILNVSFTCHMPDCLEMPYTPEVRGASIIPAEMADAEKTAPDVYRLGGNSCLSGDFMGYWQFRKTLRPGDLVIFEDMIHYTTVKTNMFNGVHHPALSLLHSDGRLEVLREYAYEDYKTRMD